MATPSFLNDAIEAMGYAGALGLQRDDAEVGTDGRGFVWSELRDKCGVSSAYFRGGVPLVAFGEAETRTEGHSLQRRLWNLSRVPILVAATDTELIAYSCFGGPAFDSQEQVVLQSRPADDAEELLTEFSRFEVERGAVFSRYGQSFSRSTRVDRQLLANLRTLRQRFEADAAELSVLDRIIGRAIFVRYFEDRGIVPTSRISEATGHPSLIEVLHAGASATYDLFDVLASRFNGDIFGFSEDERGAVEDSNLEELAQFLSGTELASGQQSLWPYDFAVIPPELVSSVYEQMLEDTQRTDGAYYTPRPVVDLILDETLPWDRSSGDVRVLDPSCGSGMFLTEAFRRLAFKRRGAGDSRSEFKDLSRLLVSSIFGVDQSETAVQVAALGLYLALLEEVDSESIWESARLPPLVGRNLIVTDFFDDHELSGERFDVVVGNPPWQSGLSDAAERFVTDRELPLPDRQLAMAFLYAGAAHTNEGGVLGFLLPSKALLHNRSGPAIQLREKTFTMLGVDVVVDLSAIRRDVFNSAVAPAAALIARPTNAAPTTADSELLHVVPRPSPLQSSIDGFVVSQADVQRVPLSLAADRPDLWKTLLWGSFDDYAFLTRLRETFEPLADLVATRRWVHGRGVQVAGGDENDASDLLGMPYVSVTALRPLEIDREDFGRVETPVMHRPRQVALFKGPHVLVRRGLLKGRPVAAFADFDVVHNDSVIGFSGPPADAGLLRLVSAYINSSLGHYYHFLTSSSWGVERDYVEENEHLSLPVSIPSERTQRSVLTAMDAAAQRSASGDANWRSTLDEAVFEAYGLADAEVTRVQDGVSSLLGQFMQGSRSPGVMPPTQQQLMGYQAALEGALESALSSARAAVTTASPNTGYVIAVVGLSETSSSREVGLSAGRVFDQLLREVDERALQWPSPAIIVQPSAIVLHDTAVYLIKPRELRYWTATQAAEDAANVLGAIVSSRRRETASV